MKRLLLPLLAAIALPTAVNAESYWLILRYGSQHGASDFASSSLEKIEMESMDQCELMGGAWASNKLVKGENKYNTIF